MHKLVVPLVNDSNISCLGGMESKQNSAVLLSRRLFLNKAPHSAFASSDSG